MAHFSRLWLLSRHLYPQATINRVAGLVNSGLQRRFASSAAETGETVITERQDNIFLVGINRPDSRNAVNRQTALLLRSAFEEFDKDHSLSVAVFYGVGGNFCAGMDLKEVSSYQDFDLKEVNLDPQGPMGPSKMILSKPVIAAVSGYAVAGGMELSLICDMRVVEKSATFGIFNRRFGIPLIDGGTVRLPKLIGLSRALDLILTGRPVGAEEAYSFGLANRVVPDGEALDHAILLAKQIAAFPQGCMKTDRRSAYNSSFDGSTFQDALHYEFDTGSEVLSTESLPGATQFVKGMGRGGSFESQE
ncbi:probable enoyl-CoA hydratase echA8 [Asterias rubens]|uniref:enoyl-CoA hydratase EchA19-like n=1 Tax=Asterias amurensis TaxID=7602 RepID=UPI001455CF62|nr:probable enoyl-CoA hydratase echA8 [Asterias rubens]